MKVLFHQPTPHDKEIFRPPEESNGPMTTSFELGGLPMILCDPLMSDSSRATPSAHTRWPKFNVWQKWVENAHFFIKHKRFIKKA